ncbi:MAG TPA: hypothetical protein VMO47_18305, partial [Rhodothermales bacterium]|nr:hypothetical protein [Rhodothermales bacterium]
ERAAAARPDEVLESILTFAGQSVNLRVVGRDLSRDIIRPIAHLKRDETQSHSRSLTIDLWDEHATGVDLQERIEQTESIPLEFRARSPAARFSLNHHQSSTLCLDRDRQRLVGCCQRVDALSLYERGRPLHVPLTLWHNDLDIPVVHAGLVARDGIGLLFAGPAGSGKSTAAVTCLLGGFRFLSDDLIGLEETVDGSFRGHSLYNSTYFERSHLQRFPILAPHAIKSRHSDEDKLLVLLHDVFPSRIECSAGIHAIVLPEVGDGARSTFRQESRAKALLALGPPSLGINRSFGSGEFEKLARLTESVPSYRLRLGSDLGGIAPAVEELIEEIG